jgi:hypothetical protein
MNNYANYHQCIRFQGYKQTCEESNIINNSQISTGGGILNDGGSSTITNINKCCLIKNSNVYLFWVYGIMELRECTIQKEYSISGAVTTSYSNTEINLEKGTQGLKFCGRNVIIYNQLKCRCSEWDIVLLHKIHIIWTILKYIKLVCYNNIFIKYTIIMNILLCAIFYNYTKYI